MGKEPHTTSIDSSVLRYLLGENHDLIEYETIETELSEILKDRAEQKTDSSHLYFCN